MGGENSKEESGVDSKSKSKVESRVGSSKNKTKVESREGPIILDRVVKLFLIRDITITPNEIGHGSYGIVYSAVYNGKSCVAKVMHPHLIQANQKHTNVESILREISTLGSLRHPSIVQFLGAHIKEESPIPIIVMERMWKNLSSVLEEQPNQLSLLTKAHILHDIACGLSYLHGKKDPMIHRDLNAKNILLSKDFSAKIGDFGQAKALEMVAKLQLSPTPGDIDHAAPETKQHKPKYGSKIDIFSFGCIVIYTITEEYPKASDQFQKSVDSTYLKVPEIERRKTFLNKMHNVPLLRQIAILCLEMDPNTRPTATYICLELERYIDQLEIEYPVLAEQHNQDRHSLCLSLQSQEVRLIEKEKLFEGQRSFYNDMISKQDEYISSLELQLQDSSNKLKELDFTIFSIKREKEEKLAEQAKINTDLSGTYRSKVDSLREEVKTKQEEITDVNQKLQQEIEDLQLIIKQKEQKNLQGINVDGSKEEEATITTDKVEEREHHVSTSESHLADSKNQLEHIQQEKDSLQEKLNKQEVTIEQMITDQMEATNSQRKLEEIQQSLIHEKELLQKNLDKQLLELTTNKRETDRLREELRVKEDEINAANSKFQELQAKSNTQSRTIEELQKQRKVEVKGTRREELASYVQTFHQQDTKVSSLEADLSNLKKSFLMQKQQLEDRSYRMSALESSYNELQQSLESSRQKLKPLEEHNSNLTQLLDNNDRLQRTFEKDLNDKKESLKRKEEELKLQKKEYADALNNLRDQHEREVTDLKEDIKMYKSQADRQEEAIDLQKEAQLCKSEAEKIFEDKLKMIENELSTLKSQLADSKKQLEYILQEKELQQLQQDRQNLIDTFKQQHAKLPSAQAQLLDSRKKSAALKQQLEEKSYCLNTLGSSLNELQESFSYKKQKLKLSEEEEIAVLKKLLDNNDKIQQNFKEDLKSKKESLKRKEEELELQKIEHANEMNNLHDQHRREIIDLHERYKAQIDRQGEISSLLKKEAEYKSDLEKSIKDKFQKLDNERKSLSRSEKELKRLIKYRDADIKEKAKKIEFLEKGFLNDYSHKYNYDVHWYPYLSLPTKLIRPSVAIVTDKVFVTDGYQSCNPQDKELEDYLQTLENTNSTFCFNLAKCQCDTIDSPVQLGALASVNGQCVLVSGADSGGNTLIGNVYVLCEEGSHDQWKEFSKPLPTPRILACACCYGNRWLIVCGGYKPKQESSLLEAVNVVEILDTTKGEWYLLLKRNCPNFSSILCCAVVGEDIFVVGSDQVIKTSCNNLIKAATSNSTLVWDNVQIETEESNGKLYPFSVVEVTGEPMIIASMTDGEDDVTCVLMKDTRGRWRIMSKAVECQHCSAAMVTSSLELLLFGGSEKISVTKATDISQKGILIPTLNMWEGVCMTESYETMFHKRLCEQEKIKKLVTESQLLKNEGESLASELKLKDLELKKLKEKSNRIPQLKLQISQLTKQLSKVRIENEGKIQQAQEPLEEMGFVDLNSDDVSIKSEIRKYGSYYVIHDAWYCDKQCIAKKEHSEQKNTKKFLKHERKFLVTLSHSCIMQLWISTGTPKSPVLLMERMWMNLTDSLANRPMYFDKTAILQDVISGLSYIHEKNIIHCNLTGDSILLTENGRAKVADFGYAVFNHPKVFNNSPVTADNFDYMPPEVLKPIPTYSTKLDVFSFGCVIIHTFTQEPPIPDCDRFVETSEVGKYKMYSEVDRRSIIIQKLRKITNDIKLYDTVLKCLQDDPSDRPSAVALCSLLEKQVAKLFNKPFRCVEEVVCPEVSVKRKEESTIVTLVVKQLEQLTTLNVSGCKINDQGANMMTEMLLQMTLLEKLNLSHTTLDAAKANKISNALRKMLSLKVLNISNNFITSEALAMTLSESLTLEELNISQNLLTFSSIAKIAQCFRNHPTLKTLDLSNNMISLSSACEFIIDIILSVNQELVYLNVCDRNIRPRFVDDYLNPPPDSENNSSGFVLQDLYLLQHFPSTDYTYNKLIRITEACPFSKEDVIVYYVDHKGGLFYHYHNFVLFVPPGAVSQGDRVEIQATASHCGPYEIPEGFYPISNFFWISADYTFKVPVYIIMSHYVKIRSLEDMDHLYVLQTNACDSVTNGKKLVMNAVSDGVYFDYVIGYCVLATHHFCSYCQVKDDKHIPEYLTASYYTYDDTSSGSYIAEVCFYPSNSECKKVIEKQCAKKNVTPDYSFPFIIASGDVLFVSDFSSIKGWYISRRGRSEIYLSDFEYWRIYSTREQILEREEICEYPPRFQILYKQTDSSEPICCFSFAVSKKIENNEKEIKEIGNFPFVKKTTDFMQSPASQINVTSQKTATYKMLLLGPKMHDLNRFIIPKIEAHWQDVAYALNFEFEAVDSIDEKHKGDPKKCCRELLKFWLTTNHGVSPKTWSTLLEKISEIPQLATICEKVLEKLPTVK